MKTQRIVNYVLDENNTLYYFYYSINKDYPWIQFIKIATDVDEVKAFNQNIFYDESRYILSYIKNGRQYVSLTNRRVEENYSFYSMKNNSENIYANEKLDFSIHTVELCEENVKYVTFSDKPNSFLSNDKDWYVNFYYQVNDITFYEQKRINGLDAGLSEKIPEKTKTEFRKKKVTIEEVEGVINELKEVYKKYE